MLMDGRIGEIESRLQDRLRDVDAALSRLAAQEQLGSQLASSMGGGGATGMTGRLYVGQVTANISAGGTGTFQPYSTAGGGWTSFGSTFSVRNLGGAISTGKKCAAQIDQSGTMIVSPLEC